MDEPAPMHKHYAGTVEFDWATYFLRHFDSGLNVEQYCERNQCSKTTWYRIKK